MEMGESIVGSYLRQLRGCDVVVYNQRTGSQGEIDVVGMPSLEMNRVWLCEVATHLGTLDYGAGGVSSTKAKIEKKLSVVAGFANSRFPGLTHHFEFWSPTISQSNYGEWMAQLESSPPPGMTVEFIHGSEYSSRVVELRQRAALDRSNTGEPAYRMLQILSSMTGTFTLTSDASAGKYAPLTTYLAGRPDASLVMDLDWVEAVLRSELSAGTRTMKSHWSPSNTAGKAVSAAGWKVVQLTDGALHLERVGPDAG